MLERVPPCALALTACGLLLSTAALSCAERAKPVVSATAVFRTCPHPQMDQIDTAETADPLVHPYSRRTSTAQEVWQSCEPSSLLENRIVKLLNGCAQSPLRQFAPGNCTSDVAVGKEAGLPAACAVPGLRDVIATVSPECIAYQAVYAGLAEPIRVDETAEHRHDVGEVVLMKCRLNMTALKGPVDQLDLLAQPDATTGPVAEVRACLKALGTDVTVASSLTTSVRW